MVKDERNGDGSDLECELYIARGEKKAALYSRHTQSKNRCWERPALISRLRQAVAFLSTARPASTEPLCTQDSPLTSSPLYPESTQSRSHTQPVQEETQTYKHRRKISNSSKRLQLTNEKRGEVLFQLERTAWCTSVDKIKQLRGNARYCAFVSALRCCSGSLMQFSPLNCSSR